MFLFFLHEGKLHGFLYFTYKKFFRAKMTLFFIFITNYLIMMMSQQRQDAVSFLLTAIISSSILLLSLVNIFIHILRYLMR